MMPATTAASSSVEIAESVYVSYGHLNLGSLAALYLLQGIGRASFEGSNRATYADLFKSRATEAFAGMLVRRRNRWCGSVDCAGHTGGRCHALVVHGHLIGKSLHYVGGGGIGADADDADADAVPRPFTLSKTC
jgi:hypothetical protein